MNRKDFTEITKDENEMLDVYEAICTCKYEYDIEMESVILVAYKLLLTGIKPKGLKSMLRVVGNINEMKLSKGIDIKAAFLAISNFIEKAAKEANEQKKPTFDCPDYAGIVNQDRQKIVDKANARIWKEESLKKANKNKEGIMKDKILTELKFEDFTEYKRHQNENGMNTEFTEYQIGYKLIKVIDGIKDVFEEGLFPALLSIVNKDNNEKCERLANPHELGIATDPVENMDGIDKVTVNGKEFIFTRKQGSIHERLNMMDKKIEILRNEKQNAVLQVPGLDLPLSSKHSGDEEYNYYSDLCDLMAVLGIEAKRKTNNDNIPAKVLATLTPEEIQQINDSRKAQIIVDPEMLARARSYRDAINSDIEEKTTIDTSLTSMDGIYKAVCDACGSSFYMKKDQYEYCPYCSRKIKK